MKHKTILIFGATSGIGKALAEIYLQHGHRLILTGRREHLLREIQEAYPEQVRIRRHDVRDYQDTDAFFDELEAGEENPDIIIYNSGTGTPNYELEWEIERNIIETNLMGAVKVFTRSWKLFKGQGSGHLVAVSSVAGVRGNRHVPAYFASKAFLNNYLESLWLKGKRSKTKIFVTDIVPGFVDTDMALGKTFWMAPLDKAARQIYNAIERKKRKAYITRRWRWVALLLRLLPAKALLKM
jgi:short-subunit dehydrogenase